MSDLRVALAQTSPVWFDPMATAQKAAGLIAEAAAGGAQAIAFPETFLSGYPLWPSRTGGAAFEDDGQKAAFSVYLESAVLVDGPELAVIADACAAHGVFAFVGTTERGSGVGHGTTYCSIVAIDPADGIVGVHRKLVPTHDERMIWGRGDGAGLRTYDVGGVRIGALNCWENWMPQARHALYADGEDVHIGLWPGSSSLTADITRFIALEGRVWSLAVGGVLAYDALPERFPLRDEVSRWPVESPFHGGSAISDPSGAWVREPTIGDVGLLFADVDVDAVRRERLSFDVAGHYARPDVFSVRVDRRRQAAASFQEG
jgi:nitrilase